MATASPEAYRAYTPRPFTRAERDSVTILFGGLHWRLERILQAVLEQSGYRARVLPMATKADLLTGREVADIGQCCPTSFTTGNLVNFLRDESRHFFFYYRQAETRLVRPGAARVARLLVDRFWAPVGSGVGRPGELELMAGYLFAGDEGRAAARKVDDTIRRLPGFATVRLLEAWMDRHVTGGLNGDGDH